MKIQVTRTIFHGAQTFAPGVVVELPTSIGELFIKRKLAIPIPDGPMPKPIRVEPPKPESVQDESNRNEMAQNEPVQEKPKPTKAQKKKNAQS